MVEMNESHTNIFEYDYEMFSNHLFKIKEHIKASNKKYNEIYAIPRGGLILGVYLSHHLNIPLVTNIISKNTLIVDDICDTGATLESYNNDKIVLVSKPKGLDKVKNIFSALTVADNIWVHFYWEA